MEVMEQGLEIQGVTAIEDKLQDGVPDALNYLRKAGTKVRKKFETPPTKMTVRTVCRPTDIGCRAECADDMRPSKLSLTSSPTVS